MFTCCVMNIDFFAAALKESLFLPFNTILDIGGNECVEARDAHVFSTPVKLFWSNLSIRTFLGRSSGDIQAIELIKQSCLQSTMGDIPIEPIRLVSASEGHLVGRP